MAYSTIEDMRAALPAAFLDQLTDDIHGIQTDDDILETAIQAADAEIDLYLGRVMMVPIAGTVPASINRLSIRLARYFLYFRRGLESEYQIDYQACVRQLEAIAAGDAVITPTVDPDDPNPGTPLLRFYAI